MALESHFFTDLSKVADSQSSQNAFGPIGSTDQEKEKKFNLTNVFSKKSGVSDQPPAIAVTNGVLFIVPQNPDNTGHPITLVNIFLKPDKAIDLGVKIKYFVYRSVKIESLFIDDGIGNYKALQQTDANLLPFFAKIWQEYLEFNPSLTGSDVFDAKKVGFNTTELKSYQDFFKEGDYNFPKITGGKTIGFFANDFGFEVVVDEGDFVQEHSDTGFEFKDDFFRAKQCILNLNLEAANKNPSNIYGNLPTNVGEKVFRESIYLFLDPAAFYGMHATTSIKGKVKVGSSAYTTTSQIATNILHKFLNKTKTYLYIKSTRGRSYGFYDGTKNIKYENVSTYSAFSPSTQPKSFEDNKWPLIIDSSFDQGTLILSLENIENKQNAIFVHNFNSNSPNNFFNENWLGTNPETTRVGIIGLPKTGSTVNANFIVCTYQDISNFNEIFGRVNLIAIFEKEDFETTSNDVSFVDHLRPVLIKDEDDLGLYHTKVVLDGAYISNTIPTGSSTNDDLRTYILFPQKSTKQKTGISLNTSVTAGYYTKDENKSNDYIRQIYGGGEIWRGLIVDTISGSTVNIKSLLYRRKDNDDEMPIYQLGISHNEYIELENNAKNIDADATNLFFDLEEDTTSTSTAFIKYELRVKFDKKNGTRGITTSFKSLYTIDGYFFFTQGYSEKFEYYKEFALTTVEFRPHQDWDGEFGMDWYRKGQYTWANSTGNKIYDTGFAGNVGTLPNQTDGNSYSPLNSFLADNKMLLKLKSREYNAYSVSWSLADNETECFTSWLSIDKGKTAKLNLRIRVKKVASKLSIRYPNKYFKINNTNGYTDPSDINFSFFDFPTTVKAITTTPRFFDLDINCIEEFGSTQILEVRADEKLAGMLKVLTNKNNPVQNILLVPVKIEMPDGIERGFTPGVGESPVAANYISNHKNWLVQFLLQSQIKANIEMYNDTNIPLVGDDYKQLNLISDINFKEQFAPDNGNPANNKGMFTKKDVAGTLVTYSLRAFYEPSQTNRLDLKQYLTDHLPMKYTDTKYKSYLIVFFMNIDGYSMSNDTTFKSQLNGYSSGKWTNLLVFKLAADNNETVSHEVYHSLGIPHTFDKTDENSLYVYKGTQTDNLLDYSHHHPPSKNRRSLFHWQWLIATKNVKK